MRGYYNKCVEDRGDKGTEWIKVQHPSPSIMISGEPF
jgi:hypothetical protein